MTWSPGKAKPPGPPLALAISLLIVGVLGAIGSFAVLGTAILHSVSDASTLNTPGSEAVVCRSGTYLLYTASGSNILNQSAVAVTGPGGAPIAVDVEAASESISRDGTRYSGVLGFAASRSGTYTVKVLASGVTLVVAPSLANTAEKNVGWLIGVGLSLLTAFIGLILLIVALVQRSGARKSAPQYGPGTWGVGPVGGWGTEPSGGPPGYGWTGSWPQQTGPPGWAPPSGTGSFPVTPSWAPPAATEAPPPGSTGGSVEPSAPADGSDKPQRASSGWPQPSTKPQGPFSA